MPRLPRIDFAKAMLADDVSPMEVAAWMSKEADALAYTLESGSIERPDGNHDELRDDKTNQSPAEDATQAFDAMLASISRGPEPTQAFRKPR